MAKPIITLNGLKIVIMLGMLVIILCGIRFAAEIIVPFILALFIAVILNPLVQHMVRWRVPRVLAVSILMTIIVMAMVLLLAYLGSALNELTRTLPQYRNSIMTPLQALEPLLQRVGIDVSVDQLAHYIDPNAAMTLLTNLLTQLSNAMSSIFLLLLTVLFEMTPTARIAVEYLIYRIALALVSSLTEIHRRQIGAAVAEQSVAKHKDIIYTLIASCNKRTAISRLTMTGGLDDRHTGITSFYPNKLPIVIQIVSKELTRLEGCITEGTLGRHRCADQK